MFTTIIWLLAATYMYTGFKRENRSMTRQQSVIAALIFLLFWPLLIIWSLAAIPLTMLKNWMAQKFHKRIKAGEITGWKKHALQRLHKFLRAVTV